MERYHVGLYTGMLRNWAGGRDLLRILLNGLSEADVKITVLNPQLSTLQRAFYAKQSAKSMLRRVMSLGRETGGPISETREADVVRHLRETGLAFDLVSCSPSADALERVMRRCGIQVILPCEHLSPDFGLPWIGYIPDLQHKHLPHFFSEEDRNHRDHKFRSQIDRAQILIVNSGDAKRDLERYFPNDKCRIFALPFSPMLYDDWLETDTESVKRRFQLEEQYFVISNQFWVHKDHPTAIRALSMIADRNVKLVCTGNPNDYRMPEYFPTIEALVDQLGLRERVRFVGFVSKLDQIGLMRGAVAVVQPTLFEGGPGGGAVYDAVALGTPAIVSDIPVNREIEEDVTFFKPGNAEELANRMEAALKSQCAPPNRQQLLARSAARRKRLGAALREIIEASIESSQIPYVDNARISRSAS